MHDFVGSHQEKPIRIDRAHKLFLRQQDLFPNEGFRKRNMVIAGKMLHESGVLQKFGAPVGRPIVHNSKVNPVLDEMRETICQIRPFITNGKDRQHAHDPSCTVVS